MEKYIYETISSRVPVKLPGNVREEGKHVLAISFCGASTLVSLNSVAGQVYKRCDGKRTISNIVNDLSEIYTSVPLETLSFDVMKCLRDLEIMYLVTVVKQYESTCA